MYKNSKEFIEHISKRKASAKLRNDDFKRLINDLDNPQKNLRCLHVAGTNGKGSVTNYLRSILQEAGYKVGTFTSPHLIVFNDRIRINDVYISDDELLRIANQYIAYWQDYDLSMFEIAMIISIIYFMENKVDYVIYEVGLGGRLDPTNVIDSLVSVIVNIGFDHMEYLGNTLTKIAHEKAGIIKENGVVFTAENKKECLAVFEAVAKERKAQLFIIDPITSYKLNGNIHFDHKGYNDVVLDTIALYQIQNAALAIEVCDYLSCNHVIDISRSNIYDGLYKAFWKGRFEIVAYDPLTIIDGAHNEHGIKALLPNLRILLRPSVVVFSALKDKQYQEMITDILDCVDEVVITQFNSDRSLSADELALGLDVTVIEDYQAAIAYAISKYKKGSVVITGSLYFISLARELFKGGR